MPSVIRHVCTGAPLSLKLQDHSNQTVAAIYEFAKQELARTDPKKFGEGTMNDIVIWGEDGRLLPDFLKLCDVETDVLYCIQHVTEARRTRNKARCDYIAKQIDPTCVGNLSVASFDRDLACKAGECILKGAAKSGWMMVEIERRRLCFSKMEYSWKLYGDVNSIRLECNGWAEKWASADEFAEFMAGVTERELALHMIDNCEYSKLSRIEGTLTQKHLTMLVE